MNEFKKNIPLLTNILILTFLSLFLVLRNELTYWDDNYFITDNHRIRNLDRDSIKEIFTDPVEKVYVPLTILFYAVEYHFFRLNPFVYHATNLFLHIMDVLLIFYFAIRIGLNRYAAGLAALLFSIHPMHVEVVAWVSARKDLLYTFFYLLSLIFYWTYLQGQPGYGQRQDNVKAAGKTRKGRNGILQTINANQDYLLSLLFGVLSILAKPMALSLPLILWVCDWWYRRKLTWRLILDKLPYFAYIVPVAWLTYSIHARVPGKGSLWDMVLVWIWTFTFYIQKFLFPIELVPLYKPAEPVSIAHVPYATAVIVFIVIVLSLVLFRRNRLYVFAVLYYVLSIFFILRMDIGFDQSFVADRFMYLPSLGICLWIGQSVEEQLVKRRDRVSKLAIYASVAGVLVFLSFKTHEQIKIWKESFVLWNYIISKGVLYPTMFNNRGLSYNQRGDYENALKDFTRSLEIKPDHASAYSNRGQTYMMMNKYDLAMIDLNKALEVGGPDYRTLWNRADLYCRLNRWEDALKDFNEAVHLYKYDAQLIHNRGVAYLYLKQFEKALEDFEAALAIEPEFPNALNNKAYVLNELGQPELAKLFADKVIKRDPLHTSAYYNRGKALLILKDYAPALADFNRTIELDPKYIYAYYCRSLIYKAIGEFKKADEDMQKFRSLNIEGSQYPIIDMQNK